MSSKFKSAEGMITSDQLFTFNHEQIERVCFLVYATENQKEISKFETQRLVSFCSTSGPLFIVGAVATGMFKNH